MKRFILCLIVLSLASAIVGLPVTKTEKPKTDEKTEEHENSEDVAVSSSESSASDAEISAIVIVWIRRFFGTFKLFFYFGFFLHLKDALEYERYLKEVVNALETDEEFRKKLDNASDVDIRVS